jgi:hypothetical protein
MIAAPESFNEIATVRIELKGSDPLIWRHVEVPTSIALKTLHFIIQASLGWLNCHLWEFSIAKQRYGPPMDKGSGTKPRIDASRIRLRDVLKPLETSIDYIYDFGDCWEHRLTVTNVRTGDPELSYPRYVGGQRNGPPENCGGMPGFYAMLDAASDTDNPDHAEAKQWLDDYDPDEIEGLPIKYALARIANQRNAAKARLAKKKSELNP